MRRSHFARRRHNDGGYRSAAEYYATWRKDLVAWVLVVAAGLSLYVSQQGVAGGEAFNAAGEDKVAAEFTVCSAGSRWNCVVDGDTFWLQGVKIRIADIDTPELSPP
ncbi:MAG TPA: hypothetical protein VGO22_09340, partial [Pseudorhizobium sp.]|nr:hypothetical protein [Pseudorhizobium sp.]